MRQKQPRSPPAHGSARAPAGSLALHQVGCLPLLLLPEVPPTIAATLFGWLVLLLVFVAPLVVCVIAWTEMAERMREAQAQLGTSPLGLQAALIVATVIMLVGFGSLLDGGRIAVVRAWSPTGTAWFLAARTLLPLLAFAAFVVIARSGRFLAMARYLAERRRHEVEMAQASGRTAGLATSVHLSLQDPMAVLSRAEEGLRAMDPAPADAAKVFRDLERARDDLRRLDRGLKPFVGAHVPTMDVAQVCRAVLREVGHADPRAEQALRLFAPDGLRSDVDVRHLGSMLFGLLKMAMATADPDEPMVTVAVHAVGAHLHVEVAHNGAPPGIEGHGRAQAAVADFVYARTMARAYGGSVAWSGVPRGTSILLVLPGSRPAAAEVHAAAAML